MCRVCETFPQLHDVLQAYNMSSARLFMYGRDEAASRDNELATAIHAELHVYDWAGECDEQIIWIEC